MSAWSSVCNLHSCSVAAETTGFCPYDPQKVQKSKFVLIRTSQEDFEYMRKRKERTRLDINGKIINTNGFIQTIINRLIEHPRFEHLCQILMLLEVDASFIMIDVIIIIGILSLIMCKLVGKPTKNVMQS